MFEKVRIEKLQEADDYVGKAIAAFRESRVPANVSGGTEVGPALARAKGFLETLLRNTRGQMMLDRS